MAVERQPAAAWDRWMGPNPPGGWPQPKKMSEPGPWPATYGARPVKPATKFDPNACPTGDFRNDAPWLVDTRTERSDANPYIRVDHSVDPRTLGYVEPATVGYQTGRDLPHRAWGPQRVFRTVAPGVQRPMQIPTAPAEVVVVYGADTYLGMEVVRLLAAAANAGQIREIRCGVARPDAFAALVARNTHQLPEPGRLKPFYSWPGERMTIEPALVGADAAVNTWQWRYESDVHFLAGHVHGPKWISFGCHAQQVPRLVHVSHLACNLLYGVDSPSRWLRTLCRGEDMVRANFRGATVVRPGPLVGDTAEEVAALVRTPVYFAACPDTLVQPVWVTDAAAAVVRCVLNHETTGNTYELGGPDVWRHIDLAKVLRKAFKRGAGSVLRMPLHQVVDWYAVLRSFLPSPVVTRDMVEVLFSTNVTARPDAGTWEDIGVQPHRIADVLGTGLPYGL